MSWAVQLPLERAGALAGLRLVPGLDVLIDGASAWLRGATITEDLEKRIRQLPAARQFQVLDDGQLVPEGNLVPCGVLPADSWEPLRDWLRVALPAVTACEPTPARVALRLVPSAEVEEPNLLRTTVRAWHEYGATAPQLRLDRWTFAANEVGEVLVRGRPLPPLPGTFLVEREGVAVPAGWAWAPALEAGIVREMLRLGRGDLAILHPDGDWERLPAESFVAARRAAIRLTAQEVGRE